MAEDEYNVKIGSGITTRKILDDLRATRCDQFANMLKSTGAKAKTIAHDVETVDAGMSQMLTDLVNMGIIVIAEKEKES